MTAPAPDVSRRPLFLWTAASLVLLASIVSITLTSAAAGSKEPVSGQFLLVGVACIAPYLLILALVGGKTRRPGAATFGFAYALSAGVSAALIAAAIAGIIGRVVVALTMGSAPIVAGLTMGLVRIATMLYEMGPVALMLVILFGVAQVQLAKAARQGYARDTGKARSWSVGRALGFATLGGSALVAISGQQKAERVAVKSVFAGEQDRESAKQAAYHTLLRVQACTATYSDSSPSHEYPAALTEMGPDGSGCLDSAIARGSLTGYVLRYHPTTDSAARKAKWWIIARPLNPQHADDALMADHLGAVYLRPAYYDPAANTDEAVAGTTLYPFNTPEIGNWIRAAACIRDMFATAGEAGGYPSDLATVKHQDWRRCLIDDKRNRAVWGDYLVSYVPDAPDRGGRIRDFTLHATPLHYGRDAVRSFLIRPDSVIHVTISARRATMADPLLAGCEIDPKVHCQIAR